MKGESSPEAIWLITFTIICCLGPILAITMGSVLIAVFMRYRVYVPIGVLIIAGGVTYYLTTRFKSPD